MFVNIARQPIFTAQKKLFAYELLFRQTLGLSLGELSGDRATTSLLSTAFLTAGIEKIAGNKICFINFTKNLLLKEIANFFPKNAIVVEILEDVLPTIEVIDACRNLSQLGYMIALDDFVFRKELLPLIELANIIKIDYRLSTSDEIERMLYRLRHFNLKFLAEKVETYEEFEHARKLGFHYFQGYFFAKPESIRMKEVSSVKTSKLRLLAEISKHTPDFKDLQKIIESDVAVAYKLLRYINSAYYYLLKEVTSIRQAIIYLGEKEIRRFVILVVISELTADKPTELLRLSLTRARFCELLGKGCRQYSSETSELFLLGLFSMIDAILDTPMPLMMEKMPLSDEVKAALTHQRGPLMPFLQAVIAYEQGRPEECLQVLEFLRIDTEKVYDMYLEAIKFAALID
jgi:EAL and modified HD-GYP domain-containing signal transduction protein